MNTYQFTCVYGHRYSRLKHWIIEANSLREAINELCSNYFKPSVYPRCLEITANICNTLFYKNTHQEFLPAKIANNRMSRHLKFTVFVKNINNPLNRTTTTQKTVSFIVRKVK